MGVIREVFLGAVLGGLLAFLLRCCFAWLIGDGPKRSPFRVWLMIIATFAIQGSGLALTWYAIDHFRNGFFRPGYATLITWEMIVAITLIVLNFKAYRALGKITNKDAHSGAPPLSETQDNGAL